MAYISNDVAPPLVGAYPPGAAFPPVPFDPTVTVIVDPIVKPVIFLKKYPPPPPSDP